MASEFSCPPAGKTRYPRTDKTAISYEYLDRDFITSSRQDAASTRRSHHVRASSLPRINNGRSVHSAKKLWEDYEGIEVRSKMQRESEKPPEVPPLRVPKNPHGLYKHTVKPTKPFHILHSPSDYGQARRQLKQLYAQVTYLSNAVRNCDGSASYRGMCKRQRSYRRDDNNPLHLHWPSSDENVPVPRLLLPVMPGTNTKWYSWKVESPRDKPSRRGRGRGLEGGRDQRYAASAPVSRSLDFLEMYGKSEPHVTFSIGDEGGRQSRSKDTDAKSRDGHLSVRTVTESLASSSLSSIVKYDANQFKFKEDEAVEGRAIFLTQPETRKMPHMEEVTMHADVAGSHGNEKKDDDNDRAGTEQNETGESEGAELPKATEEERLPQADDEIKRQSPEDEMDAVARVNVAVPPTPESPTSQGETKLEQGEMERLTHQQDEERPKQEELATDKSKEPDLGSDQQDNPSDDLQNDNKKDDTPVITENESPGLSNVQSEEDGHLPNTSLLNDEIKQIEDSPQTEDRVSKEADVLSEDKTEQRGDDSGEKDLQDTPTTENERNSNT